VAQEVRGAAVETAGAAHDLWEFWYYGEHIRCIKPRTLLNFLLSAGTQTVKVTEVCEGLGATFELIGPVDESGEPSVLVCRLDTAEAIDELNKAERELMVRAVKQHDKDFFRRNTRDAARALDVAWWRVER
jgi:hypothetical protein